MLTSADFTDGTYSKNVNRWNYNELTFLTSCPDLAVVVTEAFIFVNDSGSKNNNVIILRDDDKTW